jgi:AcrR family transcriptional regulator
MTQHRDGYHHGDLRNALVASAVRLIATSGTSSFSLREAARDVGVSANAAYRHFDDKSALMTAVAAFGFRQMATQMVDAMAGEVVHRTKTPASIARFKAVGRAYVEFAVAHPELFRVMFGECGAECRKAKPGDDATEDPWSLLGTSLDALVADGLLASEQRPGAELKAWSVVHGFASLALDGLASMSSADARDAALDALLDFAVVGLCCSRAGGLPQAPTATGPHPAKRTP